MAESNVIVVGAGPVGLFTALRLGQSGIKVTVFEAAEGALRSPRAVVHPPVVCFEYDRAGILDDMVQIGYRTVAGVAWRDGYDTTKILADLTPPPLPNPAACALMIGQDDICQILQKHLHKTGNVDVVYSHSFVHAEYHGDLVVVHIRRSFDGAELKFQCRYLIGADGARSAVRKDLNLPLEGYTWPNMRLVAVNILYDLDKYGWKAGNFIVHPEDWAIVVRRGEGKQWRIATSVPFIETANDRPLDDKSVHSIIKERVARLLPGNTDEIAYLQAAPYSIHQRCVPCYRVHRIILAGDAAHLNNPVGGLGLTTGILDAAHLAKALQQILIGGKDDDVLDEYAA
ncbi:unnamed protein product, partial [Clonostachys rosea]